MYQKRHDLNPSLESSMHYHRRRRFGLRKYVLVLAVLFMLEMFLIEGRGPRFDKSQGYQMAKFDLFLSLDCARVEGVGARSKERKRSNFAA